MTQSITVKFTVSAESADIVMELDDEKNNGKQQFSFGQKAYFKIYAPAEISFVLRTTNGNLTEEGQGMEVVKETVSFITEKVAHVQKPIMGKIEYRWQGNNLGNIRKKSAFEVECEKQPGIDNGAAIAKITYPTYFKRYAITIPYSGDKETEVLVVAYV